MDRPIDIRTSPKTPMPVAEQQMIEEFWRKKQEEIEAIEDFGDRGIPMTRLKKVICADKGKMMMTFDTPSFMTKACEIFVQELAFRAWMCASSHHRNIILDTDIAEAIASTESYDFLKDILHAHGAEHNSLPCPKPTNKRQKTTHQPSISHHPPSNQFQVPQVGPRFVGYPPYVRTPLSLAPTNVHRIPLLHPFRPQEAPPLMATMITPTTIVSGTIPPTLNYMAGGLGFFGNNINTTTNNNVPRSNNFVASGVMTPPVQVCAEAIPNIPNPCWYMNMTSASAAPYGAGGATSSNVAAQDGGVAFHCPYNPPMALQLSSLSPMANSTIPTSTGNSIHATGVIDLDATVGVDDGPQQQQEDDTTADNLLNDADESLDAVVASAAAASPAGNVFDVDWDDFVMPDDAMMAQFWEDIAMDGDPVVPLPDAASADNHPPAGDIQDIEGFGDEPYLLDDIVSTASSSGRRN